MLPPPVRSIRNKKSASETGAGGVHGAHAAGLIFLSFLSGVPSSFTGSGHEAQFSAYFHLLSDREREGEARFALGIQFIPLSLLS